MYIRVAGVFAYMHIVYMYYCTYKIYLAGVGDSVHFMAPLMLVPRLVSCVRHTHGQRRLHVHHQS